MDLGDIGDLPADRQQRIQLAARIGHHHRHVPPAQGAHLFLGQRREIRSGEIDPAAADAAGHGDQAHDRPRERRLAGAGFADKGDDLARLDRQIDAAQRLEGGAEARIVDPQIVDPDERGAARRPPGRNRRRRRCAAVSHSYCLIRGSIAM